MAHVFKIKYGSPAGWTYIDLTDANHGIVSYVPGTAGEGADEITESGRFRVAGSSVSDLLAKIAEIEQAFYKAGAYSLDQIGAYQVWLTMQPDGTSDVWESQVFEGRLELTEDVLGVDWANRITDVILLWRRAGFWEKYTLVAATNDNESGGTYTIYNSGDASGSAPTKKENWVDIAAVAVPGDLPAPAVCIFVKSTTVTQFEVFHNARALPTSSFLAEGETGTDDTTDANRSGGKYHVYTTPAGGSTGVDVLSATTLLKNVVGGAWVRFVLSAQFSGTVYARPYIKLGSKKYFGPRSVLTGAADFMAYDLNLLRIPFGTFQLFTTGYYVVEVGVNLIAATAVAVAVDYFYSIPVDSYAKGVMDISDSNVVVMDAHDGVMVGDDGPHANKIGALGTLYGGIWLEPNMAQRLTFKMTAAGVDTMANSALISVYAWLRKRTI